MSALTLARSLPLAHLADAALNHSQQLHSQGTWCLDGGGTRAGAEPDHAVQLGPWSQWEDGAEPDHAVQLGPWSQWEDSGAGVTGPFIPP